jgi:hypothetical protein
LTSSQSTPPVNTTTTAPIGNGGSTDNSRTIGILLAFSVVGIGLVSGILIYIWHKSKTDQSKYQTLDDPRLSSAGGAGKKPTTSAEASVNFTNLSGTSGSGPQTSSHFNSMPSQPPPNAGDNSYANNAFDIIIPSRYVQKTGADAVDSTGNDQFKFDRFNNQDRNSETSF